MEQHRTTSASDQLPGKRLHVLSDSTMAAASASGVPNFQDAFI
jgi:hypothetical protein